MVTILFNCNAEAHINSPRSNKLDVHLSVPFKLSTTKRLCGKIPLVDDCNKVKLLSRITVNKIGHLPCFLHWYLRGDRIGSDPGKPDLDHRHF